MLAVLKTKPRTQPTITHRYDRFFAVIQLCRARIASGSNMGKLCGKEAYMRSTSQHQQDGFCAQHVTQHQSYLRATANQPQDKSSESDSEE